ncbi:MAG: hypothetical protein Q9160_005621 [Pyrenula sp. 1 TL-2023]
MDANRVYLEKYRPNNWWTRSLLANTERRISAQAPLKSTGLNPSLCQVCRAVNWAHLLFGDERSGFKASHAETICLGARTKLRTRATAGCPVCKNLVTPLLRSIDKFFGDPLNEQGCVHLDTNEEQTQAIAPSRHRSYCIGVSLRSSKLHPEWPFASIQDDAETASGKDVYYKVEEALVLEDHELSDFRSMQRFSNLERCSEWLSDCMEFHKICESSATNRLNTPDVSEAIKLIDVHLRRVVRFPRKEDVKYATLSYVCDPAQTLCVLRDSDSWKTDSRGRLYHSLPEALTATLEDAVNVTKALRIQYLWVDSICIAQDDRVEMAEQLRAMCNIYTDAAVCIISAAGVDSHSALPGVGASREHLLERSVAIKPGLILGLWPWALGSLLEKAKWMTRAWTYQELLLSKRCVFFTREEVFFYCAESAPRESIIESEPTKSPWASFAPDSRSHLIGNAATINNAAKNLRELGSIFGAAVEEYSTRNLSYQEDALIAFDGLFNLLCHFLKTEGSFGCPNSMLLNCLTWLPRPQVSTASDFPVRRIIPPNDYSDVSLPFLPSWSWAAWRGKIKLTSVPYTYPSSAALIFQPQKPLKRHLPIPRIFKSNLGYALSPDFGEPNPQLYRSTLLPIYAKVATITVKAEYYDEAPGQADLYDQITGASLGPCDFRGQADLSSDIHEKPITFLQLYIEQNNGNPSTASLLVLRAWDLQDLSQTAPTQSNTEAAAVELERHFAKFFDLSCRIPQLTVEPPKEHQNLFQKSIWHDNPSQGCPQPLRLDDLASLSTKDSKDWARKISLSDKYLATRIGRAYMNVDQWLKAEPRDTCVILC